MVRPSCNVVPNFSRTEHGVIAWEMARATAVGTSATDRYGTLRNVFERTDVRHSDDGSRRSSAR